MLRVRPVFHGFFPGFIAVMYFSVRFALARPSFASLKRKYLDRNVGKVNPGN